MPPPERILEGLAAITNDWRAMAMAWHAAFGIFIAAVLLGWRPARRLAGVLLAVPLASVGAMAWATGNPFNGAVFTGLAAVLVGIALAWPRGPAALAQGWSAAAGALLFVFGWAYPHFLAAASWTAYLYAAPLGLIPCPTLSAVSGTALLLSGLGSRRWSLVLAVTGLFYGGLGAFRLGVVIDLVLLAGAVALAAAAVTLPKTMHARPS